MFNFFVAQSEPIQFLLLVAFSATTLLTSFLLIRWIGARDRKAVGAVSVPVGPFFSAITGLFALLLAFNAGSIWSNQHEAERAFRDAASAGLRLEQLLGPTGINAPDGVEALRRFADFTLSEEWAGGNATPSANAFTALEDLRIVLVRVAATVPSPVASYLFHLYDTIAKARADRLWVGATHRNPKAWAVILVLGIFSQFAIGLVHADRPRVAFRTMLLFTLASTAAYWLLITSANPLATVEKLLPTFRQTFLGQG